MTLALLLQLPHQLLDACLALVILNHQRVVLQIHRLVLILHEVGLKVGILAVEVILLYGQLQAVGLQTRLLSLPLALVLTRQQQDYQCYESGHKNGAGDDYEENFFVH